jgi:Xaa-Pro aminopeptidase
LLEGDHCTVYATPPAADDALWHGHTLGLDALAEHLGCDVRPLEALAPALAGRAVGATPVPDAASAHELEALMGRPAHTAALTAADVRVHDAIIALRLVHDEAAVDGLRRAAAATCAAHRAGMAATRVGRREWEIRAAMEGTLLERGMATSYPSIVTVHGEVLHNNAYHHELRPGDVLLADVGAETRDGWAGDVTRAWPVSGTFTSTQRAVYDVVLAAQAAAIAAAKPGVRYRDVHLEASRVLAVGLVDLGILRGDPAQLVADGVHALFFPHGVGHLLGLDVHDMEDLGDRAGYAPGRSRATQFGLSYLRLDRDLEPGMAVTIEPGLYWVDAILNDEALTACAAGRLDKERAATFADARGIRIEDDILITEDGCEVLTAALPKAAGEIEALVGGD